MAGYSHTLIIHTSTMQLAFTVLTGEIITNYFSSLLWTKREARYIRKIKQFNSSHTLIFNWHVYRTV